jgi:DNA uptake protein ComE-like DNA-binding protein
MNYLKSQTTSFQTRLGFALVALGGALTVLSPIFFLTLVPVGTYSLVLAFSSRTNAKRIRAGAIVAASIFLALIVGTATTAVINPEALESDTPSSQVIESESPQPEASESEGPSSQVSETEAPQPEASVSTPAISPTPPPAASVAPVAPVQPSSNCQPGQVDINSAPEDQLMTIIHIGAERVSALISLRPYSSIEGLDNINGIGEVRMAEIRAQGIACVG